MGPKAKSDPVSTHLSAKTAVITKTQEVEKGKSNRIRSFFKNTFRHSGSQHKAKTVNSKGTIPAREITSTKSPVSSDSYDGAGTPKSADDKTEDTNATIVDNDTTSKSVIPVSKHSAKERRLEAENRLQEAANALNKAIASVSGKLQVPQAIGLQHIDPEVEDLAQTSRNIEAAIDGFIDARQFKVASSSRTIWKTCATNMFKAFYPYVKTCLSEVGVSSGFSPHHSTY
jgi:hypothetical protein